MTTYKITVNNCNSIDKAIISLSKDTLNIKYGPNGLGKSSIAHAILSSVIGDGSLQKLRPFKHRGVAGQGDPSVTGAEDIKSVLVFDDNYVSQFVFQKDEVLKNSFEIFIKTDAYIAAMGEIESLLFGIKSAFDGNEVLVDAVSDLKELRDAFSFTKAGDISKASKVFKAFGSGNKVMNIPENLTPFADFIKSQQPAAWISWQTKGNLFTELSDNCPYCSINLNETAKTHAKSVAVNYDSKAIEHLSGLQLVITRLGDYFEQSCRLQLINITKSKIEISPEESNFLKALLGEVETLIAKLEGLRSMSFFVLRDVEKIDDEIDKLQINLNLLGKLNSNATQVVVNPINAKLQELSKMVGELKGKVNSQKSKIEKAIVENQKGINEFLNSAGYKYSVIIKPEDNSYRMKLVHKDFNEHIETASQHLSYGEKNAFAMVLFMHQVLRDKPDLVVLDDPVSSFDKTKKFAILNELFRGRVSLRNTTVLMLTHDIEPAIDVIRSVRGLFINPKPTACFLSSQEGIVSEIPIYATDIQTFAQICTENISNLSDDIIKCIYLRRHFEIIDERGLEYNYIANLFHARDELVFKNSTGFIKMSPDEIQKAEFLVCKHIPEFNYLTSLSEIKNRSGMVDRFKTAKNGYEKLQLFRVLQELHGAANREQDSVLQKFINETFHIENEYLMQLNPHKFDNVPEYIVEECEKIVLAIN